jgi:adenylate cyclase
LLELCEPGIIDKTRYIIPEKSGLVFEVDEFYGENKGLVIAEIELPQEDYTFDKPEWLGREVTGRVEYYNASLMKRPFKSWHESGNA